MALLLESGVAMFDALPLALQAINNGVIRAALGRILPRMEWGSTLADALPGIDFLDLPLLPGLVQTGEGSGTLPEMMRRFADGEDARLAQQQWTLWLARIVYVIVAGMIASGILSSGAIGPVRTCRTICRFVARIGRPDGSTRIVAHDTEPVTRALMARRRCTCPRHSYTSAGAVTCCRQAAHVDRRLRRFIG